MPRVFYSLLVSEKQSSCVPLPLGICAFLWWPVGSAPGSALCPPACWRTSGIQEARRQRKMTQTAAVFLKWSRTVVLLMYCQVEWERDGLSGICSDHEQDRFGAFLIGRVSTFGSFSSVIWLFHRCAMGADVPCSAAGIQSPAPALRDQLGSGSLHTKGIPHHPHLTAARASRPWASVRLLPCLFNKSSAFAAVLRQ